MKMTVGTSCSAPSLSPNAPAAAAFSVRLVRPRRGGCSPTAPRWWADHLFDPLLEWVNDSLARAKWLALYGDPKLATWARLLPDDDPSKTLRGGGYRLDFSALSEGVSRRGLEKRRILLPCRI
jgi:hypothetical protein